MTNFENCFDELNVSPYEYSWNKMQRLQIRRVIHQMFLNSERFESLADCSNYVFENFGAIPTFVHPFLPCLQHGYTKSKYNSDVRRDNSAILTCDKQQFISKVIQHAKEGKSLDSILYVTLLKPNIKFDTANIDMLNLAQVEQIKKIKRQSEIPNVQIKPVHTLFYNVTIETSQQVFIPVQPIVSPLDKLIGNVDFEELSINVLYLKDKIESLIVEQQATQKLIIQLLEDKKYSDSTTITKVVEQPPKIKRTKVLVVGMWPKQYESLRLSFTTGFFEHFDINYISSDKIRKNMLENSGAYDHVLVNTASINHVMEQIVRANTNEFVRYSGGVSALRALIMSKANLGEFGTEVRANINNWVI